MLFKEDNYCIIVIRKCAFKENKNNKLRKKMNDDFQDFIDFVDPIIKNPLASNEGK